MSNHYIFSSESVGEGHPDKVCDTISDAVLDACLAQDKMSRVACETYVKSNLVVVGGEITTKAKTRLRRVSRAKAIRDIGYVNDDDVFHADKVFINERRHHAVARHRAGRGRAQGQGQEDRGAGRGRPGPHVRLRVQRNARTHARADHVCAPPRPRADAHPQERQGRRWLRPDAKSPGVRASTRTTSPSRIANVVISTQHAADVKHAEIEKFCIEKVIKKVLPQAACSRRRPSFSSIRPAASSSAVRRATPA